MVSEYSSLQSFLFFFIKWTAQQNTIHAKDWREISVNKIQDQQKRRTLLIVRLNNFHHLIEIEGMHIFCVYLCDKYQSYDSGGPLKNVLFSYYSRNCCSKKTTNGEGGAIKGHNYVLNRLRQITTRLRLKLHIGHNSQLQGYSC